MYQWKYALSTADRAPQTAPILLRGNIPDNLRRAAKMGYEAIEVHMREDIDLGYEAIAEAMQETGTRISAIVTGRLQTEGHCSLMDGVPYVAKAAMEGMRQYIDIAARLQSDIIIGWAKGNLSAEDSRAASLDRLARRLRELADYAAQRQVKLHLEVINRYEVNLFTTAKETLAFLNEYQLNNCYVHLDTFHMMIDEQAPYEAIRACEGRLGYFHLADNSRRWPGSSCIDFVQILENLRQIGYKGFLSVECFPLPDEESAAIRALKHMKQCEQSLNAAILNVSCPSTQKMPAASL